MTKAARRTAPLVLFAALATKQAVPIRLGRSRFMEAVPVGRARARRTQCAIQDPPRRPVPVRRFGFSGRRVRSGNNSLNSHTSASQRSGDPAPS